MVRKLACAAHPRAVASHFIQSEKRIGAAGRSATERCGAAGLVPVMPRRALGKSQPPVVTEEAVRKEKRKELSRAAAAPSGHVCRGGADPGRPVRAAPVDRL